MKTGKLLCTVWLVLMPFFGDAQVGIGTVSPNASSVLDVSSTDKGVLIPRMTVVERLAIGAPAQGLLVYQTDDVEGFYYRKASGWTRLQDENNNNGIPKGSILAFSIRNPPEGYLRCDGSLVSRTTYADLFAVIGTIYGVGDGTTTFALPDYRGMFLRGYNLGATNDPDAALRTDSGGGLTGDNVGTKQRYEFAQHFHSANPASTNTFSAGLHSHNHNSYTSATTNGGVHDHTTEALDLNTSYHTALGHDHKVYYDEIDVVSILGDTPVRQVASFGHSFDTSNDYPNTPHRHSISIPERTSSNDGSHDHNFTIPSFNSLEEGRHVHSVDIPSFNTSLEGAAESRPINVSVMYMIKY